jgi:hypothetical protein
MSTNKKLFERHTAVVHRIAMAIRSKKILKK